MPNEIPGNAGRLVYTNLTPITAGVGVPPTYQGVGMRAHTVVPLIDGHVFSARGQGTWDLDEPNVPPLDARFTRGSRLTGVRGTLDLWMALGADGTARTVCYLTDDPVSPGNVIALRVDSQNRALMVATQGVIMPTPAGGILEFTSNATNTEDVTLDSKTYTFQATLTDVDGNVLIGATSEETLRNLTAAINLEPWGKGVVYADAMTANPAVEAHYPGPGGVLQMQAESKQVGTVGNSIATTENLLSGQWINGATMVDGTDGNLTTVAEVDPTGPPPRPAVPPGAVVHVRVAWDSGNRITDTPRHMSFSYNGEPIAVGYWGTDPLTGWAPWQPTHLVLGVGLSGLYLEPDFNGAIRAVQLSNLVLP